MRFRNSKSVNYLSRREQLRLLTMVGAITFVVIAMQFAAKPSSWYWLTGAPEDAGAKQQTQAPPELDFRPLVDDGEIPSDVMRIVADYQPNDAGRYQRNASSGDSASSGDGDGGSEATDAAAGSTGTRPDSVSLPDETSSVTARGDETSAAAISPAPGDSDEADATVESDRSDAASGEGQHDLSIDPELIARIKDRALGIRSDERDLYYYLLAKVRDVPAEQLKSAARNDVAFAVLNRDSQRLLCTVLTVKGNIHQLAEHPAGQNDYGIGTVWEGWMLNADSGRNPYCIRFLNLPDGFPRDEELEAGALVEVTGYFFRQYAYPAQGDRLHVAPMILARDIRWIRQSEYAPPDDGGLVPYVLAFAGILGVSIAITLWRFRVSDRQFERDHLRRLTAAQTEDIAAISSLPTIEIGESLRLLGETQQMEAELPELSTGDDESVMDDETSGNSEGSSAP